MTHIAQEPHILSKSLMKLLRDNFQLFHQNVMQVMTD